MGTEAVITMVQDRELDLLSVRDMAARCEERGLIWLHCPIRILTGRGPPSSGPGGRAAAGAGHPSSGAARS